MTMVDNTRFISFEGIDFSGKTTQINLLKEKLEDSGKKIVLMREPGGTPISEKIREILLDKKNFEMTDICEVLLYSAARHQVVSQRIIEELNSGNFVIADRYVDSTTTYLGFGRKLPMKFINQLNLIATEGLMPNITFYLDLSLAELEHRMKIHNGTIDRLEEAGTEFYNRIRKGYNKIAELEKERYKIIDASKTIEQINSEIWEFVITKLNL
jgi:dTMP kinase